MTAGIDLDRRLETWFREDAPAHAPDRVLAVAMDVVGTTRQRRRLGPRLGHGWLAMSARQRLVLVVVTLLLAIGAIVAVGALMQQSKGAAPPALVLVSPTGGTTPDGGLTVTLREADGTTHELARYTADQLGGQFSFGAADPVSADGYLAVPISLEGGRSGISVVDLRDPSAPARQMDAEGMMSSWSPRAVLAVMTNDGGYAAFDAATGVTTSVRDPAVHPLEVSFRAGWSADGHGIISQKDGASGPAFGVFATDATFRPGLGPAYQDGIGPRRIAADGARLQCNTGDDSACYELDSDLVAVREDGSTPVWHERIPGQQIADFAWAADDDGIWVLVETSAAGRRTVRLLQVGLDGTTSEFAAFSAPPDDPDPNSYFPGAEFAGFSPDDDRILVRVHGDGGSVGTLHVIDTKSKTDPPVDGWVGGWLASGWRDVARPAVQRVTETATDIRGEWAMTLDRRVGQVPAGSHRLTIRRTAAALDAGFGEIVPFVVRADGPDRIVFTQADDALGCAGGSEGTYAWSLAGDQLVLARVDDGCAARAAMLAASFEPTLPYPDTGSEPVDAGMTLLVPDFAAPFRLTPPADPATTVDVHRPAIVMLSASDPADTVSVGVVDGAPDAPCQRHANRAAIEPGMAGAIAHLESLADQGLRIAAREDVTLGGQRGQRLVIDASGVAADCASGYAPWMVDGYPQTIIDGSVVTLVEPTPGTVVAVIERPAPDAAPAEPSAWAETLVASIDFLDRP